MGRSPPSTNVKEWTQARAKCTSGNPPGVAHLLGVPLPRGRALGTDETALLLLEPKSTAVNLSVVDVAAIGADPVSLPVLLHLLRGGLRQYAERHTSLHSDLASVDRSSECPGDMQYTGESDNEQEGRGEHIWRDDVELEDVLPAWMTEAES